MQDAAIEQVRSFTRTVTQRSGALSDRFLRRGRPLGQARMLWEIGTEGCEVRSLRSRVGLDSGHASRLMRALEADGLIRVEPSRADRRQRDELLAAMRTIQSLMTTSLVEIVVADPAGADARRCIRAYFAELDRRSPTGFDPAAGISAEPHELVPPAGLFLIAHLRGEPVGCGAVKHHAGGPSHIKRMWVAESARGLGIARRLLARLETHIAGTGVAIAQLETHDTLVEAIAMYRDSGYVEVPAFNDEPHPQHWFEKRLAPALAPPGRSPTKLDVP
jgi:GNAT superfamily N-acetyltransferase